MMSEIGQCEGCGEQRECTAAGVFWLCASCAKEDDARQDQQAFYAAMSVDDRSRDAAPCEGVGLDPEQIDAGQWNDLLQDICQVYLLLGDDPDEQYASIAELVDAFLSEEVDQGEQHEHYGFDTYTAEQAMQVVGALDAWYPEIALPLGGIEDITSVVER